MKSPGTPLKQHLLPVTGFLMGGSLLSELSAPLPSHIFVHAMKSAQRSASPIRETLKDR